MTAPREKPLTTEELTQIRERCEKAIPGPWVVSPLSKLMFSADRIDHQEPLGAVYGNVAVFSGSCATNTFIAHSREDIPRLLDEIETVRGLLDGIVDLADFRTEPEMRAIQAVRAYLDGIKEPADA